MSTLPDARTTVQPETGGEPFLPPWGPDDDAWWADFVAAAGAEAPEDLGPDGQPEEVGSPAEILLAEASYYESRDTAAGRFLAAEIRGLAALAEGLHAATFDQIGDRRAVEEKFRDNAIWERGHDAGWEGARARLATQGWID